MTSIDVVSELIRHHYILNQREIKFPYLASFMDFIPFIVI